MEAKKSLWYKPFLPLCFISFIIIGGKVLEYYSNYYKYQSLSFQQGKEEKPTFSFEEVSKQLNISHRHELFTPAASRKGYAKILPYNASVAVGDINNDGYMDLFFNTTKENKRNFLYLNIKGQSFRNVTFEWGLGEEINNPGATMGGYFFDYDNDGKKDLYLAKAGCHSLYKNLGNKFVDVSKETGVDQVCDYTSGVSFLDFDNDGFLDVYVSNSLNAGSKKLVSAKDLEILEPQRNEYGVVTYRLDVLLKNQSGKRFKDVTELANINNNHLNWVTGVIDYNNDGFPDLFLSNDFSTNRLFKNNTDGSFSESSHDLGKQFFSANMSATTGDYNNDGLQDIFVSNISRSTWYIRMSNWLYESQGDGSFKNVSYEKKVDRCSWAWGSNFADFDRDGFLDLFVTNGLFNDGPKSFLYNLETYYVVPILLFLDARNFPQTQGHQVAANDRSCLFWQKDGLFYDVAEKVGLDEAFIGRGSAIIDFDNNGTLDIVVATHNGEPKLFKNIVKNDFNWVGLKLIGKQTNRDALGAKVIAHFSNGIQSRELFPTNGFSAQNDPRIFFGLGNSKLDHIEIIWPSGTTQYLKNFDINRYLKIREANEDIKNAS